MTPPKLTLTYFPFWGRGEPIRLACVIGKIPFTNKSLTREEFFEMKDRLPLGQIPILEIQEDGKEETYTLPQTVAILRYVGKMGGLYPKDDLEAAKVDALMQTTDDMMEPLFMTARGAVASFIRESEEFTSDERKEMRLRMVEKQFPKYLSRLESFVQKGHLVGETITIADIFFYTTYLALSSGLMDHIPTDMVHAYPGLMAVINNVKELPEVKAWQEKYPKPYGDFDYTP